MTSTSSGTFCWTWVVLLHTHQKKSSRGSQLRHASSTPNITTACMGTAIIITLMKNTSWSSCATSVHCVWLSIARPERKCDTRLARRSSRSRVQQLLLQLMQLMLLVLVLPLPLRQRMRQRFQKYGMPCTIISARLLVTDSHQLQLSEGHVM